MVCNNCGGFIPDGSVACPNCGTPVAAPGYMQPQQGGYPQQPAGYPQQPGGYGGYQPADQPGRGLAIASMVLGIICLVFIFFGVFAWIGSILGIIGLILGAVAKSKGYVGSAASAGLVMCIIGTAVTLITWIACAACIGSLY